MSTEYSRRLREVDAILLGIGNRPGPNGWSYRSPIGSLTVILLKDWRGSIYKEC